MVVRARPGKSKLGGVRPAGAQGQVTLTVGKMSLRLGSDAGVASGTLTKTDEIALLKKHFAAAGADKNGYLDMTEARRSIFGVYFGRIDADGDGKLTLKEALDYLTREKQKTAKRNGFCVTMAMSEKGVGLFDLIDADGDGRLTLREMTDVVKLVKSLDQNGDGCISPNEIPLKMLLAARIGPPGGFNTAGLDTDLYRGIQSRRGGNQSRNGGRDSPEQKDGPVWFRKMDRNRDGDVSPREFLGTTEQFRAIDTDKDGLISLAEAREFALSK
jgi:Ca2+-binding EF-hand superfamily protein